MKQRHSYATRFYASLLRFYPREFRDEFAGDMEQLFADQYQDARDAGWRTLGAFWLRTLKDFLVSMIYQHAKQSRPMNISSVAQYCSRNLTFARLFAAMTVALITLCVIVTLFVLPKVYMSTARVAMAVPQGTYDPYTVQTFFDKVTSERVLNAVIDELNLGAVLAKEKGLQAPLSAAETREELRHMLRLRQSRNTSLVEISVFTENSALSASIANKIAEVLRRTTNSDVVDSAQPEARPVRPNIPLNLVLGVFASLLAAVLLAGVARLVLRALRPHPVS
jgi:capsular polysaccharide biosynthesis protein